MNTRKLLTLIALGGVVALVACTSTEEDKFGSSDSFCSARSEAYCNGLAEKCASTVDACKKTQNAKCNTDAATAVSQGRQYHANAAQDCIDSINSTYANGTKITNDAEAKTTAICNRVFSGTKQANDTCANTFECEGALICSRTICAKEETVPLKSQCNNAGQECETGSYCQTQGEARFCVEKNKLDDSCDDVAAPCIESLRCTNKCVPLEPAKAACNKDSDCVPEAPYCDTTTKKCRPKYESDSAACRDYGSP